MSEVPLYKGLEKATHNRGHHVSDLNFKNHTTRLWRWALPRPSALALEAEKRTGL